MSPASSLKWLYTELVYCFMCMNDSNMRRNLSQVEKSCLCLCEWQSAARHDFLSAFFLLYKVPWSFKVIQNLWSIFFFAAILKIVTRQGNDSRLQLRKKTSVWLTLKGCSFKERCYLCLKGMYQDRDMGDTIAELSFKSERSGVMRVILASVLRPHLHPNVL